MDDILLHLIDKHVLSLSALVAKLLEGTEEVGNGACLRSFDLKLFALVLNDIYSAERLVTSAQLICIWKMEGLLAFIKVDEMNLA